MTRAIALFLLLTAGSAVLFSLTAASTVEGTVADDNGPVAGATVRWQGAASCTRTDAAGRFRLPGQRRDRPITAASPGRVIASGSPAQAHLRLPTPPSDDNDDYRWIDPAPDLEQPSNCANCHPRIHDEWAQSAHGNSATNRKFLQLFAGGAGSDKPRVPKWNLTQEHPLGSGVCAACHAPTLTSPDLDYDIRTATGVAARGVHCDYCHKIADAPTDKFGTRFGRDGYRLARPLHGEQVFFGPLDDAVRAGESFVYAPFYKESRYCASCHEGVIFGVHVYGTYSEWRASPARRQGKQCQDCHMAPTGTMTNIAPGKGGVERDPRTLASHQFPGGTPALLMSCLEVKSTVQRRGAEVIVNIQTAARNVGHRVPTGFIDRHLLLHVDGRTARDEPAPLLDGPVLPGRAGALLAGRPGYIYGKQHLDAAGAPLPFWLSADELRDTRLSPDTIDERRFIFGEAATTVRIRVLYRRFWDAVASERGWGDNDFVVVERMLEVGKER